MEHAVGITRFESFSSAETAKNSFLALSISRQWLAVCTTPPQQATLPWVWALSALLGDALPNMDELLELCNRLHCLANHIDWDQALLMPEELGSLLHKICALPDGLRPLKSLILEDMANSYDEKVSDGLSLIHVLLQRSLPTYYIKVSPRFPPKLSDLCSYFSTLTSKFIDKEAYSSASIYASIALALQQSSIQLYRVAVLTSLAAHASPAVGPFKDNFRRRRKRTCALVTKFASYFRYINASSICELRRFAETNERRFEDLGLGKVMRASVLRARIEYIHKVLCYARVEWDDLKKTGSESLDMLLARGLRCTIQQVGNRIIISRKVPDNLLDTLESVMKASTALKEVECAIPQDSQAAELDEDSDGEC